MPLRGPLQLCDAALVAPFMVVFLLAFTVLPNGSELCFRLFLEGNSGCCVLACFLACFLPC